MRFKCALDSHNRSVCNDHIQLICSYRWKIKQTHKTSHDISLLFGSGRFWPWRLWSVSLPIFGSRDWSGRSVWMEKMGVSNVAIVYASQCCKLWGSTPTIIKYPVWVPVALDDEEWTNRCLISVKKSMERVAGTCLYNSHGIHVWYIYLHLVDFYGTCRWIYHTWIPWDLAKLPIIQRLHVSESIEVSCHLASWNLLI